LETDPQVPDPIEVPELTSQAIYQTALGVSPGNRWRYRWVCSPDTLGRVRQLPPPNPDAGPIVYRPPIPSGLVEPNESPWWMAGRPIRLDSDADGLALEDAAAMDAADVHDETAGQVRAIFVQPEPGRPWPLGARGL
jgi:hypothetical protein